MVAVIIFTLMLILSSYYCHFKFFNIFYCIEFIINFLFSNLLINVTYDTMVVKCHNAIKYRSIRRAQMPTLIIHWVIVGRCYDSYALQLWIYFPKAQNLKYNNYIMNSTNKFNVLWNSKYPCFKCQILCQSWLQHNGFNRPSKLIFFNFNNNNGIYFNRKCFNYVKFI